MKTSTHTITLTRRQKVSRWVQRKLWYPVFSVANRILRLQRFFIENNGVGNKIRIDRSNKVIGKSQIIIRQGYGNQVTIGAGGKFNKVNIEINGDNNRVRIGSKIKYSGQLLIVGRGLYIDIGDNTTVNGCYILARDKSVSIGANCMISRGIEIRATDVHSIIDIDSDERLNPATQDVHIGDKVWIAADVTVSKNVTIADGCVIAAKSFVNKSVSTPNVLIAGTPAKVVRHNVRWER